MLIVKWKDIIILEGDKVLREDLLPLQLKHRQDKLEIYNWLSTRIIEDSRLDLPELLESLSIEEYKVYEIALKTKAILTGVDYYSIEWIDD